MNPSASLFVAVPSYVGVEPECVTSLIRLLAEANAAGVAVGFSLLARRSRIASVRNTLAAGFLESDATHMLFVDTDVAFDPATILRMLAFERKHRVGIVGAPVPIKNMEGRTSTKVVEPVTEVREGFVRAELIATGLMLVAKHTLERMKAIVPTIRPHPDWSGDRKEEHLFFEERLLETTDGARIYESEDYSFCRRWREQLGGEIWADAEARVQHIGFHAFEVPPLLEQIRLPAPRRTRVQPVREDACPCGSGRPFAKCHAVSEGTLT